LLGVENHLESNTVTWTFCKKGKKISQRGKPRNTKDLEREKNAKKRLDRGKNNQGMIQDRRGQGKCENERSEKRLGGTKITLNKKEAK